MISWESALDSVRAFLPLTDRIGTAGQPTAEQFAAIRAAGYEVVVNLVPPEQASYLSDEPEIVTSLGMAYVNIPVVWTAPARESLEAFFVVMDANRERRVFVHCAANMRVSAFLFLYRVLRLGMDEADAEDDLERIWVPEGVWREFVNEALAAGDGR